MKKIVLFVFLSISFLASSQELKWYTDVNEAIALSSKQKKPMLLFFTGSDWCGWCIKLQNEVFKKPEFVDWAKKNVILVELDYPRRTELSPTLKAQNAQMQQIFQVQGYPTIWFVKPEKKDSGINLLQIGKTGYVAGGPNSWLSTADGILATSK